MGKEMKEKEEGGLGWEEGTSKGGQEILSRMPERQYTARMDESKKGAAKHLAGQPVEPAGSRHRDVAVCVVGGGARAPVRCAGTAQRKAKDGLPLAAAGVAVPRAPVAVAGQAVGSAENGRAGSGAVRGLSLASIWMHTPLLASARLF